MKCSTNKTRFSSNHNHGCQPGDSIFPPQRHGFLGDTRRETPQRKVLVVQNRASKSTYIWENMPWEKWINENKRRYFFESWHLENQSCLFNSIQLFNYSLFRIVKINLLLELANISRKLPTRLCQTQNKNMGFFTCNTYKIKSSKIYLYLRPQGRFFLKWTPTPWWPRVNWWMTLSSRQKFMGVLTHSSRHAQVILLLLVQCCNDGTSEIRNTKTQGMIDAGIPFLMGDICFNLGFWMVRNSLPLQQIIRILVATHSFLYSLLFSSKKKVG